jgi:cobalt-zinc-cadmium efflux system membrane fusion protein
LLRFLFAISLASLLMLVGCTAHADPAAEAPPPANVVPGADPALFTVDHPEQFPLVTAVERPTTSELVVTGTVTPDVARNVPVVSLASGRVVAIHARLGDTVKKGQLLLTIRSDDVAGGFDAYRKAIADELLARKQLNRAVDLYAHGAIAQQDLEVAQDADKPMGIVDIVAPTSGVITDQQVTNAATVQAYSSPSPFTISDLSSVWIVCDVYENDLPTVRLGDTAEITLNAYPGRALQGRVSNIGAVLDPSIRTAKVRLELENPGMMRLGMFAKATFRGQTVEMHTVVPASALLRMHDRDFVFVPAPDKKFRRVEVVSGDVLTENTNLQEIKSGLKPGQQVVTNALVLDHVLAQ